MFFVFLFVVVGFAFEFSFLCVSVSSTDWSTEKKRFLVFIFSPFSVALFLTLSSSEARTTSLDLSRLVKGKESAGERVTRRLLSATQEQRHSVVDAVVCVTIDEETDCFLDEAIARAGEEEAKARIFRKRSCLRIEEAICVKSESEKTGAKMRCGDREN